MPIMTGLDNTDVPVPIGVTEGRQAKTADAGSAGVLYEILAELRAIRELAEQIAEEL